MSQPFYQPARQNFSSSQSMQQPQGGFGGFGGGYQMPQQSFGGGFGGGYGSGFGFGGGFQPSFGGGFGGGYGSGFGGFQPQQQFNPFQGGFGGFGGGFNPMFGGIGGLGFNPMMGPQFGMPMQGFNPDQRQLQPQQPQQNPFVAQDAELTAQMQSAPEYQAFENARKSWEGSEGYKSYQQKRQDLVRQMQESQRQPMYGGIGGLGFNPMMGPQFGMPMGQRAQLLQDQRQFGYGQDMPQMQPKEDLSFEAFKSSQPKSDPNDITQYMTMQRPSQEQQYRSWLNSKITPDTNRQLMPGESPRQNISQSDVDSIYNRYLENSRPNAQMSAQLAAAQAAQMRAVMGI